MKRMDVVKADDGWRAKSGGQTVRGTKAPTKVETVRRTAAVARKAPEPVTVKIHKGNGRIQEERTYPGKADRSRTKG